MSGSSPRFVDQAARRNRRRRRSGLARPHRERFWSLRRVICPSARPLLQCGVSADRVASSSYPMLAAKLSTMRTPQVCASPSHSSNAVASDFSRRLWTTAAPNDPAELADEIDGLGRLCIPPDARDDRGCLRAEVFGLPQEMPGPPLG